MLLQCRALGVSFGVKAGSPQACGSLRRARGAQRRWPPSARCYALGSAQRAVQAPGLLVFIADVGTCDGCVLPLLKYHVLASTTAALDGTCHH
jgi:hypothetical protein